MFVGESFLAEIKLIFDSNLVVLLYLNIEECENIQQGGNNVILLNFDREVGKYIIYGKCVREFFSE